MSDPITTAELEMHAAPAAAGRLPHRLLRQPPINLWSMVMTLLLRLRFARPARPQGHLAHFPDLVWVDISSTKWPYDGGTSERMASGRAVEANSPAGNGQLAAALLREGPHEAPHYRAALPTRKRPSNPTSCDS